jgi:hypothetical protein
MRNAKKPVFCHFSLKNSKKMPKNSKKTAKNALFH